jgi:hypothetical protein
VKVEAARLRVFIEVGAALAIYIFERPDAAGAGIMRDAVMAEYVNTERIVGRILRCKSRRAHQQGKDECDKE